MDLKTILVPVDFSANATNALRYAIQFAQVTKSKLVVFHSNYLPYTFPSPKIKKIHEQSEGRKQLMLEYIVTTTCKKYKLKKPADVVYLVERETSIIDNILAAAETTQSGLIIMGTHGATGFKKVMFGSNTSAVIEKSEVPVFAIPPRHKFKKIGTIVYASDLKNIANELKTLIPIARPFDATVEILYLDYWNKGVDEKTFKQLNDTINKSQYKKIKFIQKEVKIKRTMEEHLKRYVKKRKNSILTMFPENQNFFEKLFFSSVTKDLSFNLNKPLLSIRKDLDNQ